MPATTIVPETQIASPFHARRLLVAWQHPDTRAFALIGRLEVPDEDTGPFRFSYLPGAAEVDGFGAFVEMPEFGRAYESDTLFPLFDNRMTPRDRADFAEVAASVGLRASADPFEVLVRSGGRRATDTLEVLSEPAVDIGSGTLTTDFLVHGVSHHDGIDAALDLLGPDDRLRILLDVQNPVDELAVALADDTTCNLGWVPRYLCPVLRRSAAEFGWPQIDVRIVHVGSPSGPRHLRLLCRLQANWDPAQTPFDQA
jgi:hypothetical protein